MLGCKCFGKCVATLPEPTKLILITQPIDRNRLKHANKQRANQSPVDLNAQPVSLFDEYPSFILLDYTEPLLSGHYSESWIDILYSFSHSFQTKLLVQ